MKKNHSFAIFFLSLAVLLLLVPFEKAAADSLSTQSNAGALPAEKIETSDDSVTVQPEPIIRVDIDKTLTPLHFFSPFGYFVYQDNKLMAVLTASSTATLSYKKGIYFFKSNSESFSGTGVVRLIPDNAKHYFILTNLNRRVSGREGNFNEYQGTFEYRYSPRTNAVYAINELPLEEYVDGIAEVSDNDPTEYIEALLTAARTYAYVNIASTTPRHLFDVYASTVDQLYLGYRSALEMPRVVAAAADTAGQMVTFQNTPVITFYFGHSDGRTRGDKYLRPWLQSVPAPYDKGLKQWGHGVGMSCHDALEHALKDGWMYDQILRYYYTSTQIERIY